jgi:hypothetical protein
MRRRLTSLLVGLSGIIMVDAPVVTAIATAVRTAGVVIVAATSPTPPPLAAVVDMGNALAIRCCDVDKLYEEFADASEHEAFIRPTDMVSPYAVESISMRSNIAAWWCHGQSLAGA